MNEGPQTLIYKRSQNLSIVHQTWREMRTSSVSFRQFSQSRTIMMWKLTIIAVCIWHPFSEALDSWLFSLFFKFPNGGSVNFAFIFWCEIPNCRCIFTLAQTVIFDLLALLLDLSAIDRTTNICYDFDQCSIFFSVQFSSRSFRFLWRKNWISLLGLEATPAAVGISLPNVESRTNIFMTC